MKRWSKISFKRIEPFLYLAPFLIGIIIFTLYPIFNVFFMSFKENYKYLTGEFSGYGLNNFVQILSDPYFIQSLKNTFSYVLIVIPISTCLAIVFAVLLNQNIKLKALFQTAYFLPMVTSVTAVGMAWKFMFNYNSGLINFFLNLLGFESIIWLQIFSAYGIFCHLQLFFFCRVCRILIHCIIQLRK